MANNKSAALGIGAVGAAVGALTGIFLSSAQNRKKLRSWYHDFLDQGKGMTDEFKSTAHELKNGAQRLTKQAAGREGRGRRSSSKSKKQFS